MKNNQEILEKKYLGVAKVVIDSIDHYREAGRDDKFNIESIAEYLQKQFSSITSGPGEEVEKILKQRYDTLVEIAAAITSSPSEEDVKRWAEAEVSHASERELLQDALITVDEWLKSDDVFITDGKGGKILPNAWIDCKGGSLLSRLIKVLRRSQRFLTVQKLGTSEQELNMENIYQIRILYSDGSYGFYTRTVHGNYINVAQESTITEKEALRLLLRSQSSPQSSNQTK